MASNRTNVSSKQWRPPVSAPLCAACNKTVYPAEEVNGAGQKYHKLCLKCSNYFPPRLTSLFDCEFIFVFSCM